MAGSDGLVRDPDDAMASPFTEVGQASALHPRADGWVAEPHADRAECYGTVACPDRDGVDPNAMVETGDGTVADVAGRPPVAAGHHADCFAGPAIADRSVGGPAAVLADTSRTLAEAAELGLDPLPYVASRFATPITLRKTNRPTSRTRTLASDNPHTLLATAYDGLIALKFYRANLAQLMQTQAHAIEIAFMFNRSQEGLMGQACPERSEGTLPRGRDARTGQFTTVEEAQQHPSTHVVERVPKPGYGDRKRN